MSISRLLLSCAFVTLTGSASVAATSLSKYPCHVRADDETPVTLRDRPRADAKVAISVRPGDMIYLVHGVKEPEGWVFVHWWTPQETEPGKKVRKKSGRAWMKYDNLGECGD